MAGRPLKWTGPIGDLARKIGRLELARRLGVTPRTLQTWAKKWEATKRLPSGPPEIVIRHLCIAHGISTNPRTAQ